MSMGARSSSNTFKNIYFKQSQMYNKTASTIQTIPHHYQILQCVFSTNKDILLCNCTIIIKMRKLTSICCQKMSLQMCYIQLLCSLTFFNLEYSPTLFLIFMNLTHSHVLGLLFCKLTSI